jgi:hypothetical protein
MDKEKNITFFVNNNPVSTEMKELTGSEIKSVAGIPADYELWEVRGDQTVPVGNDQVVKIHNNEHFRAIPPGTFGLYGITS